MNRIAATLGLTTLAGAALLGASHLAISGENAPKPLASVTAPAVASAWMNPPARSEIRQVRKIAMVETVPAVAQPAAPIAVAARPAVATPATEAALVPLPPTRPTHTALAKRPTVRVAQKPKAVAPVIPAETVLAAAEPAPRQERTRMAGPIGDILGGLGILD